MASHRPPATLRAQRLRAGTPKEPAVQYYTSAAQPLECGGLAPHNKFDIKFHISGASGEDGQECP